MEINDALDVLRARGMLAPDDYKLNGLRGQTGDKFRRLHAQSRIDALPNAVTTSNAMLNLAMCEDRVGPHIWPVMIRILIEGASVRDCRQLVFDVETPWRADAVVLDRLRIGLDMLSQLNL